jgi:hypothetical protein
MSMRPEPVLGYNEWLNRIDVGCEIQRYCTYIQLVEKINLLLKENEILKKAQDSFY